MIFILRTTDADRSPNENIHQLKVRRTPAQVDNAAGKFDFFCLGAPETVDSLRGNGQEIVEVRDGWYETDDGGGMAIWGRASYWEIRSDPFTVEKAGASSDMTAARAASATDEVLNIRESIFGV